MNSEMTEAVEKVESNPSNRDPHNRLEIESALTSWSGSIQQMLDGRFGKGKVVHMLVIAPVGRDSELSWISTAGFKSVKGVVDALQQRFKFLDENRITIPNEHFGG